MRSSRDNVPGVPRGRVSRTDRIALVVYAGAALALAFADYKMRRYPTAVVTEYIPGVLDGRYGAPAIYRVLAPYLTHAFTSWSGLEPLTAFLLTRLVTIYAAFAALHVYLRSWYSSEASVAGVLAAAAFLPLTFTNNWMHPDSFPELLLFTLGCLAVARGADGWLYPIVAVATLNRETAAFLVALWAFVRWGTLPIGVYLIRGASYTAVWAIVYAGLRWWRGLQHYDYWMLDQNLAVLRTLPAGFDPYTRIVGYLGIVFLTIPLWLAIKGSSLPDAPAFFRRAIPVALLLVIVGLLFSAIAESRIFLPVVPLLLPGAVGVFAGPPAARPGPPMAR